MEEFVSINGEYEEELLEKKSRFIAFIKYINSQEEAEEIIQQIKKKYHDARHNCYAYRVLEDDKIIEKNSDDGEPSGTAGLPILQVIKSENLCNVVVIVTRYFGGILLGTGGLVRAYSESVRNVIQKVEKIKKKIGIEVELKINYNDYENLKYYCNNNDISILNVEYLDVVICKLAIKKANLDNLKVDLNNKMIKIYENLVVIRKIVY